MARPVFDVTLQSAATTGNGTGYNVDGVAENLAFYIAWSAGVSAGAVIIEEAPDKDYAGTWSVISPAVATSAASSTDVVHLQGSFKALRARISTNVVGGTVTVSLVGQS